MSLRGQALSAVGLFACSAVLWGLPTGYPLALPGQRVLAAVGLAVALWRLSRLLRVWQQGSPQAPERRPASDGSIAPTGAASDLA